MELWVYGYANNNSEVLKAIESWYAPSDLYLIAEDRKTIGQEVAADYSDSAPESKLIGENVRLNKQKSDAASPVPYIQQLPKDETLSTFYLAHGDADEHVPYVQTKRLYYMTITQESSPSVTIKYIDGGSHGCDKFAPNVDEEVIAFLGNWSLYKLKSEF